MDDSSRVDNHMSPANCIPVKRRLIQDEVVTARLTQRELPQNRSMEDWDRAHKAWDTMDFAHRHQPGEKGSSTFGPSTLSRHED